MKRTRMLTLFGATLLIGLVSWNVTRASADPGGSCTATEIQQGMDRQGVCASSAGQLQIGMTSGGQGNQSGITNVGPFGGQGNESGVTNTGPLAGGGVVNVSQNGGQGNQSGVTSNRPFGGQGNQSGQTNQPVGAYCTGPNGEQIWVYNGGTIPDGYTC